MHWLSTKAKFSPEVGLIEAAGARRRSKAVADVNSSFRERLSHLQSRLDEVIKDSRETRYTPYDFFNCSRLQRLGVVKRMTTLIDELKTMDEELLQSHESFEVRFGLIRD